MESAGLDSLGKVLTPQEVASFLRVSVATVCRVAEDFGGVRVGEECVFFENALCDRLRQKLLDTPTSQPVAPPAIDADAGNDLQGLEDRHDIFGGVGESVS